MKRLAVLFLLTWTMSSVAFPAGMVGFGAHGNYANLNVAEPLKPVYGAGFGGGLHFDLRFGIVSVRVNGDYTMFGADADAMRNMIYNQASAANPGVDRNAISTDGGRIRILSFAVNGKFNLPNAAVSPYLVVGLGSGTLSMSDLSVTYQGVPVQGIVTPETITKLLSNAGIGVDFSLGAVSLFVETKYTWLFTEGEASTYLPITVGVTF